MTLPARSTLKSGAAAAEMAPQELLARFRTASNPWYASEAADEMARFSMDRGLLGFSPTEWMAGAFGHLVNQGVEDGKAAEIVRKLHTYGGRSGLEKSVNFVFFPFSFDKKVYGQIAHFMADDLGRTVVTHDALKAYDILNDRYDLSDKLKDHMPILEQVAKLNAFAHGMSLGELGGVNRPLLEAAMVSPLGETISPVLNLFLPQGLHIDANTNTNELQRLISRLVPAYNDISGLLDDTAQQGHVVFSSSHITDSAEVNRAYREWDDFKKQVSEFATQNGVSWDKFMRSPKYASMRQFIEAKRAEIGRQYPAWADARAKAAAKSTLLNSELTDITVAPRTPAEAELSQFAAFIDTAEKAVNKKYGASLRTNPDAAPPEFYDAVRNIAIALARQGNGFERLYDRYFAGQFGPITEDLTA